MYIAEEHLYLTEDDRVVSEDDPDARWLYAGPGAEIPQEEAERYGLLKAKKRPSNKARAKSADKAAGKS